MPEGKGNQRSEKGPVGKGSGTNARGNQGGGAGGVLGGGKPTTNEMAKRLAPRMDVPVNRTVDVAPRGVPNRTNEPGERVPSYPFGLPYGVRSFLGMAPFGPTSMISGVLSGALIDKYNEMGIGPGPQVGTAPAQTRSNLPGGSGVGGSVNSGGALRPTIAQQSQAGALSAPVQQGSLPEQPVTPQGTLQSRPYLGGQHQIPGLSPYFYSVPRYDVWRR